jgi:arylsulfatase
MQKHHNIWVPMYSLALFLSACGGGASNENGKTGPVPSRPNILFIVADDLGYTDLGVYGGEIETPHLDQLAKAGLMLTDFHNQAVCAPTRASILAGTDNRNAGGAMHQTPNQIGVPGYESHLSRDVVPFSDLLRQSGYITYFLGKWHLGSEPDLLPNARGFDRSYALMEGFASHFHDKGRFRPDQLGTYYEDGKFVENLPEGFFSTDFYTDLLIDYLDSDIDSDKPWFAYLAYTAPHWPLQAPDEYLDKYKGVYDEGYEVLREQRIARGKERGVIPQEAKMYPRLPTVPPWNELSEEEKAVASREMEIYAAMVDGIDQNVGRLLSHLKAIGEYNDTLIVFISDNGAEGVDRGGPARGWDNRLENLGRMNSYVYYGEKWAQAGVGVGRYHKSLSSEGGSLGPALFYHKDLTKKGEMNDEFMAVTDFYPTFVELAGASHLKAGSDGKPLHEVQGHSLLPVLFGDENSVRAEDFTYGWEVFGHRAIRKGDYKLLWLTSKPSERGQYVPELADQWGLYDLSVDPGETNDLSDSHPEIRADLLKEWDAYLEKNGIVLPVAGPPPGGGRNRP